MNIATRNQREESEKKYTFNEIRQLSTSSGQKGRENLLINQFRLQIHEDNTPQYTATEFTK